MILHLGLANVFIAVPSVDRVDNRGQDPHGGLVRLSFPSGALAGPVGCEEIPLEERPVRPGPGEEKALLAMNRAFLFSG